MASLGFRDARTRPRPVVRANSPIGGASPQGERFANALGPLGRIIDRPARSAVFRTMRVDHAVPGSKHIRAVGNDLRALRHFEQPWIVDCTCPSRMRAARAQSSCTADRTRPPSWRPEEYRQQSRVGPTDRTGAPTRSTSILRGRAARSLPARALLRGLSPASKQTEANRTRSKGPTTWGTQSTPGTDPAVARGGSHATSGSRDQRLLNNDREGNDHQDHETMVGIEGEAMRKVTWVTARIEAYIGDRRHALSTQDVKPSVGAVK